MQMDKIKPLKIFVCEDIKEHCDNYKQIIKTLENDLSTKTEYFLTAESLIERLKQIDTEKLEFPQLILLDIELPRMDGITVSKQIHEINEDIFLVFVTAFAEYAVKGYGVNAFRYLVKPLNEEVMRELFSDIRKEIHKRKHIFVRTREGEMLLSLKDVIYIGAEDKYTVLYTKQKHYITDVSLKKYEEDLVPFGFYRVHRKYLVNLYHHKGLQTGKVLLSEGNVLSTSKRRMADYQNKLFHFLREL